jgi:pentapeptide MXKDX repeat protein
MKRFGTAALALGMTLAMATGSFAQTGRDGPQNGTSMDSQKGGSMDQKGGTMQNNKMQNDKMQSDKMQNDNMKKGTSGTMSK